MTIRKNEFEFKPFDEMTVEDYKRAGFMSGLEIHQQLLTKRKLFCRCPAGKYNEKVDAEIIRHMRPTLSELGEYDGTALMEFKTKKEIVYLLNQESVCTYEMDDAPPFEPDPEAIEIALKIAILLKLKLVNELHIARKQYLDGSIPTGFQRTTIFGADGEVDVEGKPIRIFQLGLEEDSCREVSDIGHRITFRTDRLGMPLIETVTYPDMKTPQEVAEVAEYLRRLVRATGLVRTGAGAGREDVNVSIEGGTRVEIKGVPSIKRIPRLVYNEAMRQHNLLKIKRELEDRGITKENFKPYSTEVTHLLKQTEFTPIEQTLHEGGSVIAVKLSGFSGLLAHPTQEHTYFAQEFVERVKVIACLMDWPNILHSDSTEKGISPGEWSKIRKKLRGKRTDTLVLVWGDIDDAETGGKEIILRALDALDGVPSETRQAYKDGTNGFERILPGPDRMYPDTDEPPIAITDEQVMKVKETLPELPWSKRDRYIGLGVPSSISWILALSDCEELFDSVYETTKFDTKALALIFVRDLKYWKKIGLPIEKISEKILIEMIDAVNIGKVAKDSMAYVLKSWLLSDSDDFDSVLEAYSTRGNEDSELMELIEKAGNDYDSLVNQKDSSRHNYSMGIIMNELRGRISAKVVSDKLNKALEG